VDVELQVAAGVEVDVHARHVVLLERPGVVPGVAGDRHRLGPGQGQESVEDVGGVLGRREAAVAVEQPG
jgi:hypothetical protein